MTRTRYEIGNLKSREMSSLAGFRSLTDLDLDEICRVEQVNIDAEACRRDLLAAKFLVVPSMSGISPPSLFMATMRSFFAPSAYARNVVSPWEPNDMRQRKSERCESRSWCPQDCG